MKREVSAVPRLTKLACRKEKAHIPVDSSREDIAMAIYEEAYTPFQYAVFWVLSPLGLLSHYLNFLAFPLYDWIIPKLVSQTNFTLTFCSLNDILALSRNTPSQRRMKWD